ncbi:MAG TPA: signal peptidase I [Candidatus Angelobacter sp.]
MTDALVTASQDEDTAVTPSPEKPRSVSEPEPAPPAKADEEQPGRRSILEVKSLLAIAVIVLFVITFAAQAFRVPSESMENTLLAGDFLLADKVHSAQGGLWGWILPYRDIQRGDVIVFHYPVDPGTYFVKRVIAIPGDRLYLKDKVVYLNGVPLQESYAIHALSDHNPYRDNFPDMHHLSGSVNENWRVELQGALSDGDLTVPAGRYFVMGDNRDRSLDSRYWGFVPRGNIMGRPLLIYLSVRGLVDGESGHSDDKLDPSGQVLAHFFQLARWDRMFRLVR